MKSKSQKIRLGIFITFSTAVMMIVLLLVGGSKFLTKRNTYFIAFENISVSGLEVGGTVKYLGVRIGRIEKISIDSKNLSRVIIEISVEKDIPIKNDVKALVSYVGITGLKLIELTGGSTDADILNPGSFIETGKSITEDITGKASVISEKVESLLNNLLAITSGPNKNKFISLVDETNTTLKYVNILLKDNLNPLNKTFVNLEAFSGELKPLAQNASRALISMERSISRLDQVSSEIDPRDLKRILKNTGETMAEARKMIAHIDLTVLKGRSDLLSTLNLLRRSMQNISDVSRMLTEDPSILIRGVDQKGRERRR